MEDRSVGTLVIRYTTFDHSLKAETECASKVSIPVHVITCAVLAITRKPTTSWELLLWMTPLEALKTLPGGGLDEPCRQRMVKTGNTSILMYTSRL
eukprot:4492114-Lingulodinium_polyedra.AAC.1